MVLYPKMVGRILQNAEPKQRIQGSRKRLGVSWNGDFIFQIENIPVDKISVEDLQSTWLRN